jgi:hypothetical protein
MVEKVAPASLAVFEQGSPASFCMYCGLPQASFFSHAPIGHRPGRVRFALCVMLDGESSRFIDDVFLLWRWCICVFPMFIALDDYMMLVF